MDYIRKYHSPVGILTAASDGKKISGLWIEGQKYFASTLGEQYREENLLIFEELRNWLDCYFDGKVPESQIPIAMNGSEFQCKVLHILCEIPYGQVVTYGQIAKRMAKEPYNRKTSARAVGAAIAHNPISILVPCHRVIGSNRTLTGYAGGIEIKKILLDMEGAKLTKPYVLN